MTLAQAHPQIDEEDRLRADLYNYLGVMLARAPDEMLLAQTAGLSGDASPLGQAIEGLARVAKVTKPKSALTEYNALFIGLGRGELLPYASYYMTGFLNEKPLANLRSDLMARGIKTRSDIKEQEDHIGTL